MRMAARLRRAPGTIDCFASLAMTNYRVRVRTVDPTGKSTKSCRALCAKIFSFRRRANQNYKCRHPVPYEGASAIVTNVGMGCGGRGSVGRAKASQGGFNAVSDAGAQDERR